MLDAVVLIFWLSVLSILIYKLLIKTDTPKVTTQQQPTSVNLGRAILEIANIIQTLEVHEKVVIDGAGRYLNFEELPLELQHIIEGIFYITRAKYNWAVEVLNAPQRGEHEL